MAYFRTYLSTEKEIMYNACKVSPALPQVIFISLHHSTHAIYLLSDSKSLLDETYSRRFKKIELCSLNICT